MAVEFSGERWRWFTRAHYLLLRKSGPRSGFGDMGDFRKKYPEDWFGGKKFLQGNTWRKKFLHWKNWRIMTEKNSYAVVCQEKIFFHHRFGKKILTQTKSHIHPSLQSPGKYKKWVEKISGRLISSEKNSCKEIPGEKNFVSEEIGV